MQLDADRKRLLAKGRNHADLAEELKKTKKREEWGAVQEARRAWQAQARARR